MISTMQALTEVPVGTVVQVRGASTDGAHQVWERTSAGFTKDGLVVRPAMFRGAVEAGSVFLLDDAPPEPGHVFVHSSSLTFVVCSVEAEQVRGLVFGRDGAYANMQGYSAADLRRYWSREVEPAEWTQAVVAVGQQLWSQTVALNQATAKVAELRAANPEQLRTDLVVLADALDSVELDRLLTRHGTPRERAWPVTVTVTGYHTMTSEDAVALIERIPSPEPLTPRTSTLARLRWQFTFEVKITGNQCVCDQVTREMVQARLPEGAASWSYAVTCPHH